MKKESSISKKKVVKKPTRHYKAPANSKPKIEVVEVLAAPPKKRAKLLIKTESEVEAELTEIAFDKDIPGMLRASILQILINSKHAIREQNRKDKQFELEKEERLETRKLNREKFEFIKSKVQGGTALTFEDTSDIDKEINMLLLGTTEKAKEENGSTENNSVEAVKW